MNKSLLIAVFVPTPDEASGELATGYPVGKDLILTARHVLQPKPTGCPDKPYRIKIRWHYYDSGWIDISSEDIIWQSQGKLDAALIRCLRRPSEAVGWGMVSNAKPDNDMRWHSAGFPRAAKYDNVRKPSSFGGWVRSTADQDDCFELTEDAQPDSDENWKGASGMPVFVGGRILGVVQSVPPNFKAKKLYATPTWKLFQDDSFRKALGLDDQNERLERARKLLSRLLQKSDEVTRELATKLELSSSEMPECRAEVVEELLNQTPEWLFEQALSLQEARRDKKDRVGAGVAADLMLTILPAIHDAGVVSDVRRRKGDVTEPVIALPTELGTLAEIIMAGADHREALLRPVQAEGYFPDGEPSLAPPPESGRDEDADGKQFSRDLFTHLVTVFGNDCGRFDRDFRDYLKERFIQRNQRSTAEERLREAIVGELKYRAKKKHLTHYFIAEISADASVRQGQEKVLAELKRDFPPIAFLRLAGGEGLAKERERYRPLCDLLYQNPEADG